MFTDAYGMLTSKPVKMLFIRGWGEREREKKKRERERERERIMLYVILIASFQ